jgi:MFS family permease
MVILAITWLITKMLEIPGWILRTEPLIRLPDRKRLLWLILASAGTILLVGTFFGYFPQGLGAWISALPAYLSGWLNPLGVPSARLLTVLLFYAPAALLFGLGGLIYSWVKKSYPYQWLSIWLLVSLAFAMIYPGRQLSDLVWALVPLWGLASLLLSEYLPVRREQRLLVAIQAVVVFILMAILGVNLTGFNQPVPVPNQEVLRWLVLGGLLILAVLTTLLVGLGWSWDAGVRGLVWGVTAALVLYGLSGMWSSTQPVESQVAAIWNPSPLVSDADLLRKTIEDLSTWSTGRKETIAIVAAVDSPSMRWFLRKFPNARITTDQQNFTAEESVPIVITYKTEEDPTLAAAYRGQDFAWRVSPEWAGALAANVPVWMVYRQTPEVKEEVILWGRADLFPGVTLGQEQQPGTPIEPENPENEIQE